MFIAEIGINHNGSLDIACKMINKAKQSGADVVKFQKRTVEDVIPKDEWYKPKETLHGTMHYIDYKKTLEFGEYEYNKIDELCKQLGIKWTASVWDTKALDFICNYDIPFVKIPSACITDIKLLEATKEKGLPIVMSTGMSTIEEVNLAIDLLNDTDLILLHCNSSYPANDNELNLSMITILKQSFPKHKIGYSGHEIGIDACIVAKVLGAEVFEKHVTLDRTMWGSDQAFSLHFDELKLLIDKVNQVDLMVGDGIKKVTKTELEAKKKLRRF